MKKLLLFFTTVSFLISSFAFGTLLVSGSKYPIVVHVFDVTNQCNQEDAVAAAEKAAKDMKSMEFGAGFLKSFKVVKLSLKYLELNVKETLRLGGCYEAQNWKPVIFTKKGQSKQLNKKFLVFAYKDPVRAWLSKKKKIVNPFPAIFMTSGDVMSLETIKAKTGIFFGLKGDLGLKVVKK